MQQVIRTNNIFWVFVFFGLTLNVSAQQDSQVLRFEEYLAFVKQFHPVAKQAGLVLQDAEAKLLKSRGAFDPKLEVDYDRKKFKNTEYYDKLDAVFKIPTWYGIELKAKMEDRSGDFLNPEAQVPVDGLYSAGVSFSVLDGLLINDRMAQLKQAKFYNAQSEIKQGLLINKLLFEASVAYFKWLRAHQEAMVYEQFYENARFRLRAVKKGAEVGDRPAIDTVEAKLTVQNRLLAWEQAKLEQNKNRLELSNYLWIENEIPIELQPSAVPETIQKENLDRIFGVDRFPGSAFDVASLPQIQMLNYDLDILKVDQRLKTNQLLPDVTLEYQFYSETPETTSSFNTQDYFAGVQVAFPLFLRKERGELKLAKIQYQDKEWELKTAEVGLLNQLKANQAEIDSFQEQSILMEDIVRNYQTMLSGEERKFGIGESSLFLVNSREQQLILSQIKQLEVQYKLFSSQAKRFKLLGVPL